MPREFEYKSSEFKQREKISTAVGKNAFSTEEFESIYGKDEFTSEFEARMQQSANDVFATKYGAPPEIVPLTQSEQYYGMHITSYDEVAEEINDTHKKIFKGKSLSSMTKNKRLNAALSKQNIQQDLGREKKILLDRRKKDWDIAKASMSKYFVKKENLGRYTKEELGSLREFLVYVDGNGHDQVDKSMFGSEADAATRFAFYLRQTEKLEPKDFAYESDAQFVSEFAVKYDKLCKAAACDVLLEKYREFTKTESVNLPLSLIRAKIEVFKEIKADYEDRMNLISSPYYVLLAKKDVNSIDIKGKDPKLVEFVELAKKLQKSKVSKGADLDKNFLEKLKKSMHDQAETDKKAVRDLTDGVEIEDKSSKDASVTEFYKKKKAMIADGYPKDDAEFIIKEKPEFRGTLIYGMSDQNLIDVEAKLSTILTEGTIGTQKISDEHLKDIREQIMNFVKIRKEYMSACVAGRFVTGVVYGCGLDLKNPDFKKTDEYKKIQMFLDGDAAQLKCQSDADNLKAEYFRMMIDIFANISTMGYSLSEKYEPMLKTKEEEALEQARVTYEEDRYNLDRKLKDKYEKIEKETGKERPRIEFRKIMINGEEFTDYGMNPVSTFLADKKTINVEGEDSKELMDLFARFIDYQKQLCILDALFRDGGGTNGEKSLVIMGHTKRIADELMTFNPRLNELLAKHVEGFKEFHEGMLAQEQKLIGTYSEAKSL